MQLVPKAQLAIASTTNTEKITLDVRGMKCGGCVRSVEKQLNQNQGVRNVCVNLATQVAVVEIEKAVVNPESLVSLLTDAGFPSQLRSKKQLVGNGQLDIKEEERKEKNKALVNLYIAAVLLILSGIGHFSNLGTTLIPGLISGLNNIWFHCGLATLAILIPGRPIITDGWQGWRRRAPNMNSLVGLGTLTAYFASLIALLFPQMGWECFFDEPVMLLGFIILGKTLEELARARSKAAFQGLLSLQPQTARLIANPESLGANNTGVEIPADEVRAGEWLQVLPGEQIPVDGKVVVGQSTVDESMLTGESVFVFKEPGNTVSAGTINQSGVIAIRATRIGSETTLAQIVALVEDAQTRKAPIEQLADTVSGYFTYGVLTAAFLTFLFWYFFGSYIWGNINVLGDMGMMDMPHHPHITQNIVEYSSLLLSLKLAIAVMVVACPCALGLATPTAILVGTAMGAQNGLLIKGGDVLQKVYQLQTVVFDKTGTLTNGKPKVTDCLLVTEDKQQIFASKEEILKLAAAVEAGTNHPLGKAILEFAQQQELSIPPAVNYHTELGNGVSADVEGNFVLLGNYDWLNKHGVSINQNLQEEARVFANQGKTVVYVAVEKNIVGLIAMQDTLRDDAKATVEELRSLGFRVMVLSGDREEAARAIARQLNIDDSDAIANVPPAKKAAVIQVLQRHENKEQRQEEITKILSTQKSPNYLSSHNPSSKQQSMVAMVGDGINDAPALSQADVGIALHSGTDIAQSAADIVLMRDRLLDVVRSIKLSRATFQKIQQNLFWAFAYNTLAIPLAAGILLPTVGFVLTPAMAGALMAFSSITVVINSLLLRNITFNH
jgi:P-type Cu2+ transporter